MVSHCIRVKNVVYALQAISVAERVSDERCEPSPGCDGSLVGYQVRLDSARCHTFRIFVVLVYNPHCNQE